MEPPDNNARQTSALYLKRDEIPNARFVDPTELGRYWGYLANNVVFIQISTDVSSALKIFETVNERGIGLNPMDLLKNLLFTRVKAEEFGRLKNEWKKITAPLEKAKEKPLRFLRYFLMANYTIKSDRSDAIVREDEIYDWFTNKENAATSGYAQNPFEFVRKVVSNVESYLAYASGMGNDKAPNVAMSNSDGYVGLRLACITFSCLRRAISPNHCSTISLPSLNRSCSSTSSQRRPRKTLSGISRHGRMNSATLATPIRRTKRRSSTHLWRSVSRRAWRRRNRNSGIA